MIRNRYQEMQDFIIRLSTIYQNNTNKNYTFDDLYSFVYTQLVRIGSTQDGSVDFSNEGNHAFDRLKTYFGDRRNLEVFIDPRNNYFLQLQNKPELHENNVETIRLYIPQNEYNLERSARNLFDFMADSNISHISKISRYERNDDIVVQVTNMNDAIKILNYAKGDRQIQSGLLDSNPFCYSEDGIAMAFGRNGQSINTVVASLLTAYSLEKIANKKYDEMFLLDFISYTNNYLDHHFNKLNDIGEVVADFRIKKGEENTSENNKKIANVENIIRFYLNSIYPMYNLESFNKDFLETSNDAKLISQANAISVKRTEKQYSIDKQFVGTIDNILLDSVDTFKAKYRMDDKAALDIVKGYIETNDYTKITRDNDTRNKYEKNDFAEKMKTLLALSNSDLETYYLNKKKIRAVQSLEDAIMETYLKYEDRYEQGFEQVDGIDRSIYALKRLITTGEADGFTRNNNARANLIKNKDPDLMFEGIIDRNNLSSEEELSNKCREYVTKVITSREVKNDLGNTI